MSIEKLLRRSEASAYLKAKYGLSYIRQSLAHMAVFGTGPAYRRVGRYPLYSKTDLDAFARSKIDVPLRYSKRKLAPSGKGRGTAS
jgi:hypothetical protein